ncbi:hypothetical protein MMC10_008899 [Thelotrema lepadinum]|nr:hypothetical protein [Thelotrema lepadinum]
MPMQLIFLSGGGYFFDSSVRVYWTEGFDDFLKSILKGTAENTPQVKQILCLETVLQSNGLHASFICYRCSADTIQTRYNFESSHPKLVAWLDGNTHSGEHFRISLGPKGQFFASSACGYRWHGVRDDFQEDIQKMMAGGGGWEPGWAPDRALFGVDDSYLITCKGGKHLKMNRSLQIHYADLYKELKDHFHGSHTACGYKYITINQHKKDEWVVVWNDETIAYKLPPALSSIYNGIQNGHASSNESTASTASSSPTPSYPTTRPNISSPHASTSNLQTTMPTRPSLASFASSPASFPSHPLISRPYSQPGTPQHSTVSEIMHFFEFANRVAGNLGSGGGNGGSGLFSGGSSSGQNPFFPSGQMMPMGMDPSSVLSNMGMDPSSMLSTVGLDPGSIVAQNAQNMGCSLM